VSTTGTVAAVCAGAAHGPLKPRRATIELLSGLGVRGDAHAGVTVQHRSRARAHPGQPNRRQVHLLARELHEELAARGFPVAAGQMGENVLTAGVDLLDLPRGTRLHLGDEAVVELTGLRNPCTQLDGVQPGLMAAVLGRTPGGALVRRAGVMAIVVRSGRVAAGDGIEAVRPEGPFVALEPV
jgi:MOSC domain-containing protein YiiM